VGPEFVAAGILVGAPSLNGKPIGMQRFWLSLGYWNPLFRRPLVRRRCSSGDLLGRAWTGSRAV